MNQDSVRQYLEQIIHTMDEGLFIVGPDGHISMVNDAMTRMTGYEREELLGKPCTVLNCDECAISRKQGRSHWCRLFDQKRSHRRRCNIQRKDGTYVPVIKNATLLTEDGEVLAGVETMTDISELAGKERAIEQLERMLEHGFHGMIGESRPMRRMFDILERAAASDAPVLILGESGTGKELAARAIHDLGRRREKPYVELNCAALNESILESELFGHAKGAFTGAIRHREGRFEAAHGGDIFLDEIGDVPVSIQVKLLRVLESGQMERVGENQPLQVDVRVITATNRDLAALVEEGRFRRDFFYRINVIPIRIPPLRERREDIPLLSAHFISRLRNKTGKDVPGLSPEAMRIFMAHAWPGNVRELKSALEYAFVAADSGPVRAEQLPPALSGIDLCPPPEDMDTPRAAPRTSLPENAPSRESDRTESIAQPAPDRQTGPGDLEGMAPRPALVAALRMSGGNKSQAARLLGVNRGTVLNRMRKYGVDLKKVIAE